MSQSSLPSLQPPSLPLALSNIPRSGFEILRLSISLQRLTSKAPRGDGHPVLALPGYGGGDGSMRIMRDFLNKIGYQSFAMDLGVNFEPAEERIQCIEDAVAFREKMSALVMQRVDDIVEQTGQVVTLIGWSMGGLYAFDVSQAAPEKVRQLITLGAPFGDPRGTSMYKLMRIINRSTIPIEAQDFSLWMDKTDLSTDTVPIKIIFSEQDGIVAPAIAQLAEHECVEHIEVASSHVGFTHNVDVYGLIAELLAELPQ